MPGNASIYFDLKVSNEVHASVSIRKIKDTTWAYEIAQPKNHAPKRGTLSWTPQNPERPEYLQLALQVLGDYYVDLAKQDLIRGVVPIEQL